MATVENRARAEAFLKAYILPRKPETEAQNQAFENAVEYQAAMYDALSSAMGVYAGIDGISSISNDGVSVSFSGTGASGTRTSEDQIDPVARAILFSAGLLKQSIPYARKRP